MQSIIIRICFVWVALLAVFLGKSQFAVLLFGPDYTVPRHIVMAVLSSALTVPLIVLVRHYVDREPFSGLGLQHDATAFRPFLVGVLSWLGPFVVGFSACLGLGLIDIRVTTNWSEIFAFLPLLIVLVFLLEALPEELAFRGYLQTNLGKFLEPWLAVTVQAVLFGSWGVAMWLITSGGIDPLHASLFYVMGGVLGALRVITGSVWTGIGFHLAFQTIAQLLLSAERGHFEVEGLFWLQVLALGALPFSLAIPIVERFYPDKVRWTARSAS